MAASKKPKNRKRCIHCNGSFWSNNIRRIYCSGNCNTQHNRSITPAQAEAARKRARDYYHSLDFKSRKDKRLKDLYGISLKTFKQMKKSQKGLCAICQKKLKLMVDHSHKTGKVRGLLCNGCNRGLGYFSENKNAFINAAKYLCK